MALEKVEVTDKIEVLEMGQVQVRTATRVLEDGAILSSSFHRHVLAPNDDLTDQDPKVVAIAQATWTPEVIADYEAMLAEQEAELAIPTE
jgi:hypothetical protein